MPEHGEEQNPDFIKLVHQYKSSTFFPQAGFKSPEWKPRWSENQFWKKMQKKNKSKEVCSQEADGFLPSLDGNIILTARNIC